MEIETGLTHNKNGDLLILSDGLNLGDKSCQQHLHDNEVVDEATGLTREHKEHIRKSWEVVCTMKTKFGVELFAKFFTTHPSAKEHFAQLRDITDVELLRKSPKMKAHGYRVVSAFCSLVENLDTPDVFIELLKNTGYSHMQRAVPRVHFENLGGVFLTVMSEQLGDKFTAKTREAWGLAYAFIVKVILASMDEMEAAK